MAAFSPSPSPCFVGFETFLACTGGELRTRLEAALVECDQYFVTSTIVVGRQPGALSLVQNLQTLCSHWLNFTMRAPESMP